jgi:hypothetical protein
VNSLSQTQLHSLMTISQGNPEIVVGLIDGVVDFSHPSFKESMIKTVKDSKLGAC